MKEWTIAFGKVLLWSITMAWACWMLGWAFSFDIMPWWVNTLSVISLLIYLTILFKYSSK